MKTVIKSPVRYSTVKLVGRLLQPIAETGVIPFPELNNIMANLQHLAKKGEVLPDMEPRLLKPQEAAHMLGVSYSNFRNLERDGHFPFQRKMVGTGVRYFNTDIMKYILALGDEQASSDNKDIK
jgi:predicted DNA-binding transcriptional regulator AlpA